MNAFTQQLGIQYPIICGAMFPSSNPELVAAASEAGAIGIVQPLSLTYVHGYDFREGLKYLRTLTSKPYGLNLIVERSSSKYEDKLKRWTDIALEEGCRFFITALGNPDWVVEKAHAAGGLVYHDVTSKQWAEKALEKGVDGLICVNNRAGGHAGRLPPQQIYDELKGFNAPLVCAGGIGNREDYQAALNTGYSAIQMGTRFIATTECSEKDDYKQAIINATEKDIILTKRVTGVPLSVIHTEIVDQVGTEIGPVSQWFFQNPYTKPYIRLWYAWNALRHFKKVKLHGGSSRDYWQAGKSVEHIHSIKPVADIIKELVG